MRAKSPRAAREHRARIAWLRRTTHEPARCQWPGGCVREAVDPHERLTRGRGGSITDPDNVALLCREHHDWIGRHPAEAQAMGMLVSATPRDRSHIVAVSYTVPGMPARRPISIRVSDTADEWIEAEAKRAGVSRATVLRAMLSTATQHADEVRRRVALTKEA